MDWPNNVNDKAGVFFLIDTYGGAVVGCVAPACVIISVSTCQTCFDQLATEHRLFVLNDLLVCSGCGNSAFQLFHQSDDCVGIAGRGNVVCFKLHGHSNDVVRECVLALILGNTFRPAVGCDLIQVSRRFRISKNPVCAKTLLGITISMILIFEQLNWVFLMLFFN